jgi:HPr kinase/phosphorylase
MYFTVLDLLKLDLRDNEALDLSCIGGRTGLGREITAPELNRPGLALAGFYEEFAFHRIQVFGRGENAYLEKIAAENKSHSLKRLFDHTVPCCVFTDSLQPTDDFWKLAESAECPILQTSLSSSSFIARVVSALTSIFAPSERVHGVLIEVFGLGALLQGPSGVGKSEAALALIERGHRFVADDVVEIRRVGNMLIGQGIEVTSHHLEIRGIGILNIAHLFGVGAIRESKHIQLAIQLEEWNPDRNYDRIGDQDVQTEIIDTHVRQIVIPVRPGRPVPILIETAVMNERLKHMGYNSAKEFNRSVMAWMSTRNSQPTTVEEW